MNTTLYIVAKNNVHIQIICDDWDFMTLVHEKFSYFAEGYRFAPSFKNHSWNGKINMLKPDGTMYFGLYQSLYDFCVSMNHPVELDPKITKFALELPIFKKFVETQDVHTGGTGIMPYYYQLDAVHFGLEQQRCILLSPTSSGKSLIAYLLAKMYQRIGQGGKCLIIVPTVGLVTQMKADFGDYSSHIEWDVEEHMHQVKKGVKDTDKFITVSTYQSLSNKKSMPEPEYFQEFEFVIVDEVHTATANSIIGILDKCINAKWRVGLTGTLDKAKCNEMTLTGLFGPVKRVITTKELMEQGKVAQLTINTAILKHNEKDCKFMRSAPRGVENEVTKKKERQKADYAEEIEFICTHAGRNRLIMKFAASLEGNTIIMINQIEHANSLYQWMTEALPDRTIYLYIGDTKADERERIRQAMETDENAILIGSLGTISTGISIKRLHNLLFVHPTKSFIKTIQSIGRILRKSEFGNEVTLYDFVDDFRIGAYDNYTYEHGVLRQEYYAEQQHTIHSHEVIMP